MKFLWNSKLSIWIGTVHMLLCTLSDFPMSIFNHGFQAGDADSSLSLIIVLYKVVIFWSHDLPKYHNTHEKIQDYLWKTPTEETNSGFN